MSVGTRRYKAGDYFGEVALLRAGAGRTNGERWQEGSIDGEEWQAAERTCTVNAVGRLTVLFISREAFDRLMGPCLAGLRPPPKKMERSHPKLERASDSFCFCIHFMGFLRRLFLALFASAALRDCLEIRAVFFSLPPTKIV